MRNCDTCGQELPVDDMDCPECMFVFDDDEDDGSESDTAEYPSVRPITMAMPSLRTNVLDVDDSDSIIEDAPAAEPVAEPTAEAIVEQVVHEVIEPIVEPPTAELPVIEPDAEPLDVPTSEEPTAEEPVVAQHASERPAARPIANDLPMVAPTVVGAGGGKDEPKKWYPYLNDSPVFATDLPEIDPEPGTARPSELGIDIRPTFEFRSAPGADSPAVHVLLDIEPAGPSLVNVDSGPVAHVVLALDLSASMNHPDKYPVLTNAIEGMIRDLQASQDGDVLLSIVAFAYGAEILLRDLPTSRLDAREVLRLIDGSQLRFGRYTDLQGALSRAGRIALDAHRRDKRMPIRIYALTDGQPQDMDGAREVMDKIKKLPVDVHGLCFGADADVESLQELLAGGRGGTVKHVRAETLATAFGHIARDAQQVVAKRSLLDVELRDGVVGGTAFRFRPGRFAYGKNAFKSGRHFSTDLGTLESGRRYSLMIQLRLPKTEDAATEIGRITVRVPGDGGAQTFEALLSIDRHPGSDVHEAELVVTEARHVLEAIDEEDPQAMLRSLRARRRLYVEERRDPYLIELIDRAIAEVAERGSLEALSKGDRAALRAHTCSVNTLHRTVAAKSDTATKDTGKKDAVEAQG